MRWKKSGLMLIFLFLISILVVSCDDSSGDDSMNLDKIWKKVLSIGKLEWLGFSGESAIAGFMRILVAILVFAGLYELGRLTPMTPRIRGVIAGILAIISAVFIPGSILAGIGGAYGTITALVLIGIPLGIGGYALYRIPSDNAGQIIAKLCIIVALMWILMAVKGHATDLVNAGPGIWSFFGI